MLVRGTKEPLVYTSMTPRIYWRPGRTSRRRGRHRTCRVNKVQHHARTGDGGIRHARLPAAKQNIEGRPFQALVSTAAEDWWCWTARKGFGGPERVEQRSENRSEQALWN